VKIKTFLTFMVKCYLDLIYFEALDCRATHNSVISQPEI